MSANLALGAHLRHQSHTVTTHPVAFAFGVFLVALIAVALIGCGAVLLIYGLFQ